MVANRLRPLLKKCNQEERTAFAFALAGAARSDLPLRGEDWIPAFA